MRETVHSYQTWRFDRVLSEKERTALLAAAKTEGISCEIRTDERFAATYVLAHVPEQETSQDFAARNSAPATYDPAIIAVAIEPQAGDALPALFEALSGDGAPAGVVSCERRDGALILEFTPSVTAWHVVRALIDVELKRFGTTARKTTLLSPLTLQMQTQIAADGLECPDIAPGRVLEKLLSDVHR